MATMRSEKRRSGRIRLPNGAKLRCKVNVPGRGKFSATPIDLSAGGIALRYLTMIGKKVPANARVTILADYGAGEFKLRGIARYHRRGLLTSVLGVKLDFANAGYDADAFHLARCLGLYTLANQNLRT